MQTQVGQHTLASLDRTRIGQVEDLVEAVKDRLPFYTAIVEETGEVLRVTGIENRSVRNRAALIVRLNGKEFTFEGIGARAPLPGDDYFDVVTFKPEADGTVPTEFRILDGGYQSFADTPEVPSPSRPTLRLTLKDSSAEERNAPLIAHHEKQKRLAAEEEAKRRQAEAKRRERERQAALTEEAAEIRSFFVGRTVRDIVVGPENDKRLTITFHLDNGTTVEIVTDNIAYGLEATPC